MILIEFKKYLFLCALRIVYDKTKRFEKVVNGKIIYTAPFAPPPMILKAWDMVILYSESYIAFCQEIFNGFLEKP